jgi:hypothetical protein
MAEEAVVRASPAKNQSDDRKRPEACLSQNLFGGVLSLAIVGFIPLRLRSTCDISSNVPKMADQKAKAVSRGEVVLRI